MPSSEAYANELLAASAQCVDAECIQLLLDALLRLKAAKRGCAPRAGDQPATARS